MFVFFCTGGMRFEIPTDIIKAWLSVQSALIATGATAAIFAIANATTISLTMKAKKITKPSRITKKINHDTNSYHRWFHSPVRRS